MRGDHYADSCLRDLSFLGFSHTRRRHNASFINYVREWHIPNFVSLKERYICTPEVFLLYIERMGIRLIERSYLNLARVDRVESFEEKHTCFYIWMK